ncbi:hypothetical protein [Saccharomonospora cyanea]|uniref:Uncharacterized protein n=1 Tax=Saccharomonospora cyanea NA-134 TaxID=882082 RepID=H5XDB4_9PSEU|nr:hypothetical protein [Saccharomonospora cyanea]EHR59194.1 hypothetical protein SaccyDRAFT_0257 [Saccharomonospora cyanea NA-134]
MSEKKPKSGDITENPGWFGSGYSRSGGEMILGIHANWPAYPCAPGGGHGLFDLAQFPVGTRFFPIDDIDRCVLFCAYNYDPKKPERTKDPMSPDAFQVAIWHEDLVPLQEQGLIRGITLVSEREFEIRRRAEWGWPKRRLFMKLEDGTLEEMVLPPLPPAPEEDFLYGSPYIFPAFDDNESEGAITITPAGWELVTEQLAEHLELPGSMPDLKKLLDSELYDHAVREVGIAIEEELRLVVGNDDDFGQRLVGGFIKHLDEKLFAYNTLLKIYRLRLRTFFKFTRNPHAHRKITLTRPHALALTSHALELLSDIQQFHKEESGTEAV